MPASSSFLGSEEFPVSFENPSDAEESWERDDMHAPFALTPLAQDMFLRVTGGAFLGFHEMFDAPQRLVPASFNGYAYFSFRPNVPEGRKAEHDAWWLQTNRDRIPLTRALWDDEVLPELREMFDWIAALPIDDLPREEAAAAWEEAWRKGGRAWILHFLIIMGPYQVLEDLVAAYSAAMGPGHDAEALGLVGGGHHVLEDVEEGIEGLAELARAGAGGALAQAIEAAADAGAVTDEFDVASLRSLPGGDAFVDALDAFLAEHGHLGQNHDDLRLASWAEAPRLLFGRIARLLQSPAVPVRERAAALARRAGELEAQVRAALADRPQELQAFETTLAHARDIGWLTEGHNYWIDRLSQARLRALSLRVGARLVRDGVLSGPDDVFFLYREEIAAALRDGRSRADLVGERRAEHARNEARTAPHWVGKIPEEPPAGDLFDGPRVTHEEGNSMKGTAASAGVVRGTAKVTLSQDDFGRIEPGDIIVCPSSNPSWVPIFTIAGGLITNTGGVLSHAAVVAREFELPAVVGVTDATTRIADGRLVEIDGSAGTVTLL
ncbi:MAG TPA: PEP-utilizing enzyme [Candidatus Limnocylindrales bacterium]|nr:PEP-utilizing enzyme [Candidatus Limnocylindrales bacterium]